MFDPLRFSKSDYLEPDGAEYFLYMKEQEENQERQRKLDKAVQQFRRLKNAGYDLNNYIDDVMAAAGVEFYSQDEANYIMEQVG